MSGSRTQQRMPGEFANVDETASVYDQLEIPHKTLLTRDLNIQEYHISQDDIERSEITAREDRIEKTGNGKASPAPTPRKFGFGSSFPKLDI
jgi:hypothetical protein